MKKSFFSAGVKAMFFGLATIAMVAMPSCKERNTPNGGEDNNGGNTGEVVNLTIDPVQVEVLVGETAEVKITAGNGGYEVISADAAIATATIEGEVVTVKGVKAGATVITVKDAQKKAAALKVTVTNSGKNNINTDVTYTITSTSKEYGYQHDSWGNKWDEYCGPKTWTGTYICTKRDFDNNKPCAILFKGSAKSEAAEFFEAVAADTKIDDPDNVFVTSGIGYAGATEYGHAAVALLLTDQDDPAHPGCKVMKVIASCISGYLGWENGKYTSTPGTAWYNPADGSFTVSESKGHLAWEGNGKPFELCVDRTYTPEK